MACERLEQLGRRLGVRLDRERSSRGQWTASSVEEAKGKRRSTNLDNDAGVLGWQAVAKDRLDKQPCNLEVHEQLERF